MMKESMKIDTTNDFGFSFVDEAELKAMEKSLQEELAKKDQEVILTANEYKEKLEAMKSLIMPFLESMVKEPKTKTYIYWPDRVERVNMFIHKINKILE